MRLRHASVLPLFLLALVGALLVATPAEAASSYVTVSTRSVVISSNGNGKVFATCHSSTTCRGSAYFAGTHKIPVGYSIAAHSQKWIALKVSTADPQSPWSSTPGSGELNARPATLRINEGAPKDVSHDQTINAERWKQYQQVTGRVAGSGPAPSNLKVTLSRARTGLGTTPAVTHAAAPDGTFAFNIALGTNNSTSAGFQLSVSGDDGTGTRRSWYWRGTNGAAHGGGKYVREASSISVNKFSPFVADFDYGSISGRVVRKEDNVPVTSAEVTVAAPPVSFTGGSATTREFDLEACANVFAETKVDGNGYYTASFLPSNHATTDERYLVRAESSVARDSQGRSMRGLWNNAYGTCSYAMSYSQSTANLIPLSASAPSYNGTKSQLDLEYPTGSVYTNASYQGYSPTELGDRFVSLREYQPGQTVLGSKVVKYGTATSSGIRDLTGVTPGRYWLEVGRRTSCSAWYGSRFSNNSAYFQGLDRGAEAWKTVAGRYAEHAKSIQMGFPAGGRTPPAGAKGWMYRSHCAANGKGYYVRIAVSKGERVKVYPTITKGAVITGHVSRSGGRTNKEIMVSVTSSAGVLVRRTHLTTGGGNFTIRGLASGNYRVSVNSDSWRGIGRSFSGPHTKRVTAGKSYSLGTLKFSG